MENYKQNPPPCFLNNFVYTQIHINKIITNFLIFISGLALGITLSFYVTPNLNSTIFKLVPIHNNPLPPSSPPPPPPPRPRPPPPSSPINETIIVTVHVPPPSPSPSPSPPPPYVKPISSAMHGMDEEELLWKASMAPRRSGEYRYEKGAKAKVAYMFLTRGDLPLAPLWERFFKGHEGEYSIYVHANPDSVDTTPENSLFYGRRVPSQNVTWGAPNMVQAERRLLANALLDITNQRFILLSESCIPLFNFKTIYDYLMASTRTFVEAYDLPGPAGRVRYRRKMKPTIMINQWRKGSQWFEIDRELALEVISDTKYFPLFERYCTRSCYSDEHYLPTFVSIRFWRKNANRTLHWVDWSRGGAHPSSYQRTDVTYDLLNKMRFGTRCDGNSTNMCHLFARKFMPNALDRLLRFAPKIMQFN